MNPSNDSPRRDFLKDAFAASAIAALTRDAAAQPSTRFNGIQMGPHTMLDEGIDRCLDLIQETAAINAVMVYSHTYHADIRKPPQMLATDHGVPPRRMSGRRLPSVWVRHHEQYFKGTTLRHQNVDSSFEYANRDLLAELVEPCRKRGMKLYARILEGSGRGAEQNIAGFSQVLTRDIHGRVG